VHARLASDLSASQNVCPVAKSACSRRMHDREERQQRSQKRETEMCMQAHVRYDHGGNRVVM